MDHESTKPPLRIYTMAAPTASARDIFAFTDLPLETQKNIIGYVS